MRSCLQSLLRVQNFTANDASRRHLGTLVMMESSSNTQGGLAASSLNTLSAANALGAPVTALVAGHQVQSAAEAASKLQGVTQVLVADHSSLQHLLAEPVAALLCSLQDKLKFDTIVAPASAWGRGVLPRAAALLGVQAVADISKVLGPDTYVRPIYAGNALATVKYAKSGLRMMTVRPSSFPQAPAAESAAQAPKPQPVPQEALDAAVKVHEAGKSQWVNETKSKSERPELGSAKIVVAGGRALKTAEHFKMLESLADALGGAVGASRAAVDAGVVPNDLQVGQTGKVIAPDLYISVGISGAIQHLAGIKDAKTIVAINNDPEAPIFQVADYGLVADLYTAIPELEQAVRKLKSSA